MERGRFIVLEGIDGSGKSTQTRQLSRKLRERGVDFYVTREPTDGPIGSVARQFLSGRLVSDERTIAALFAADRLDHLLNPADGILEKVERGVSVVCDRYYLSSYGYHGAVLPMEWVIDANAMAAAALKPDCTLFLDIEPEIAVSRLKNRGKTELFETIGRLTAVRTKYFEAIELLKGKENIVVLDGNGSAKDIERAIWKVVSGFFTG